MSDRIIATTTAPRKDAVAPDEQTETIEVAHEARARRWTVRRVDGRVELVAQHLVAEPRSTPIASAFARTAAGATVRLALLESGGARLRQAARQAVLGSAAQLVLSLQAGDARTFAERAGALRAAQPDLVVVPVGDRADAERAVDLGEALRLGCGAQRPMPRVALAGGDAGAIARLREVFGAFPIEGFADLRSEPGLGALVARIRELRRADQTDLVLRDEAVEELARALGIASGASVVVIDVAGASTSIVRAVPEGVLEAVHAVPLGVGRGADHVVARAGLDRVRRWIPWAVDVPTLLERVFNRARWPDAVPVQALPLALEMALAREAIAHALGDAVAAGIPDEIGRAARVVITGRPAGLPRAAQSALVAIDSLEPVDLQSLERDADDALIALGAAAVALRRSGIDPRDAIADAIDRARQTVGAVAPIDGGRRATIRVSSPTSATEERVPAGAFFAVPAQGPVEVGTSGAPLRGRVTGGPAGVIVDARGRPLALPARDAERVPTIAGWHASLDALPAGAPAVAR